MNRTQNFTWTNELFILFNMDICYVAVHEMILFIQTHDLVKRDNCQSISLSAVRYVNSGLPVFLTCKHDKEVGYCF